MAAEVRKEFSVHLLNDQGVTKATMLALAFSDCLDACERAGVTGRELALVVTKLQEASFFAKRSIALQPEYQKF